MWLYEEGMNGVNRLATKGELPSEEQIIIRNNEIYFLINSFLPPLEGMLASIVTVVILWMYLWQKWKIEFITCLL